MDIQEIVVIVLFIAALIYVARIVYRSFQAKSACGSSCKCDVDFSAIEAKKEA